MIILMKSHKARVEYTSSDMNPLHLQTIFSMTMFEVFKTDNIYINAIFTTISFALLNMITSRFETLDLFSWINYTHFKNETFDRLYEKAYLETNSEKRSELYTKMDSLVMQSAPIIPLFYDEVVRFTRKNIEVQSVSSKIISKDKNLGYIRLKSFNENSDTQFLKSLKKFEKNPKIKGYVIDLRNNPGGLLTKAINITDFFLNDGEIVSTKGRNVSETRKFFAKNGDEINGKPIIVLINYGSASASEILAGALKDHKRAIILGENSYGKGSVQSIIPLRNKGGIRLTISKYYLPSGKSISEVGVTPDIVVEEVGENFKIKSDKDNQLNYAIKLFNS